MYTEFTCEVTVLEEPLHCLPGTHDSLLRKGVCTCIYLISTVWLMPPPETEGKGPSAVYKLVQGVGICDRDDGKSGKEV